MLKQNCRTMGQLRDHCKSGGRMVSLYAERDRLPEMGAPEPRYLTMLKAMKPPKGKKLYVMPVHTDGRNPSIPNAKGPNELDTIVDRIQIGYGDSHCGRPIDIEDLRATIAREGERKIVEEILGEVPEDTELLSYTALGTAFLSMVAVLSQHGAGIYRNHFAQKIGRALQS